MEGMDEIPLRQRVFAECVSKRRRGFAAVVAARGRAVNQQPDVVVIALFEKTGRPGIVDAFFVEQEPREPGQAGRAVESAAVVGTVAATDAWFVERFVHVVEQPHRDRPPVVPPRGHSRSSQGLPGTRHGWRRTS